MSNITIEDVKKLRDRTCCGVSDCKKALVEAEGDFEKAVDILRKKGLKVAAARSGMSTSEGVSISTVNKENNFGAIVLLSCETDFVSGNAMFIETATKIVNLAVDNKIKTLEELKNTACSQCGGSTVNDIITELIAKVGENITLSGYELLEGDFVSSYTHFNKKIAVLLAMDNVQKSEEIETLGKNLSMQIAAYSPIAVSRDKVCSDVIEREKEIAREQSATAKTPEIAEKMVLGRLEKFYKESVLLEQASMMDEKISVEKYVKNINPNISIKNFKRISIG